LASLRTRARLEASSSWATRADAAGLALDVGEDDGRRSFGRGSWMDWANGSRVFRRGELLGEERGREGSSGMVRTYLEADRQTNQLAGFGRSRTWLSLQKSSLRSASMH